MQSYDIYVLISHIEHLSGVAHRAGQLEIEDLLDRAVALMKEAETLAEIAEQDDLTWMPGEEVEDELA